MNRNVRDAEILIAALAQSGVKHVCLSPGSRNTPLVFAAARHGGLRVTSHLDERCAAFFALGLATADGMPAVLICTSGSAGANCFPAIVEAHQARVPMIIITADRPHELRHSGANQTMQQPGLYGEYALWSLDLPVPEAAPSALSVRNLRASAARAVATACGVTGRAGVVHINMPFRPPLEPTPVPGDAPALRTELPAVTRHWPALSQPAANAITAVRDLIAAKPNGLIVCGPRTPQLLRSQLPALSEASGYAALVDGVSGMRFGVPGVIGAYDSFLNGPHRLPSPELVLRFGGAPTSKWLNQYLEQAEPREVIQVQADGVWADDTHRSTHMFGCDPGTFARMLSEVLCASPSASPLSARIRELETRTWAAFDTTLAAGAWYDAVAMHDVLELAPAGSTVFAGNSLPVRHLDQFGRPGAKPLFAHANRGVSGIDGNVSSALGLGLARDGHPLIAIIGDVTLYHDMNGLLAARRNNVPMLLVVLNNNGGGIFQRLPVNAFDPEFTEHFVTPHGLDYRHAAALYGFEHMRVTDRAGFQSAFTQALAQPAGFHMIEVHTDARQDLRARGAFLESMRSVL